MSGLTVTSGAPAIADLIPVGETIMNGKSVQTANARDLHAFLKIGKDFSSWAKAQVARARLIEGRDYTCSPSRVSSPSGTKHSIEYHFTLEAGKHVGMMSDTEKGFEVREYFIECERRALAPALPNFANPAAAARAWADEVEAKLLASAKVEQLEHVVAEQAPAVAGFDLIANTYDTMCIREAAAALQMRQCDLTDMLVAKGWIYQRPGKSGYLAYAAKRQSLLLKHKVSGYEDPNTGEKKVKEQVLITGKGLAALALLISKPNPSQGDLLRASQSVQGARA